MPDLRTLLAKGYFPEALPPPFITHVFAKVVTDNLATLPPTFTQPTRHGHVAPHSMARVDILRRALGIPNPVFQFNLSSDLVTNWPQLAAHFGQSAISVSAPVDDVSGIRAVQWSRTFADIPALKAALRSTSRWILTTDIAKFYPSIYTHSIPWALHGKAFAKSQHSVQYLGNSLDRWVREGQDAQTVGIPVGPDTSLVIEEVILTAIDKALSAALQQAARPPRALRQVDDYEFGCKTYADAENTLAVLQEILNDYELIINFEKTSIQELPLPIDDSWVSELRQYVIRRTADTQHTDLIAYFSRAFELARQNARDSVLKYAIRRLRNEPVLHQRNWALLENFLLQCASVEAGTIQPVLEMLIDHNSGRFPVSHSRIAEVLNDTISAACPLGYTNEAAWSIWGLIHWDLPLETRSMDVLSRSTDNIIALLALDAQSRGLAPGGIDVSAWRAFMTGDDLFGKQWLLSYEANFKNWLPSHGNAADHVTLDSDFGFLKRHGVYFYDVNRFNSAVVPRVYTI